MDFGYVRGTGRIWSLLVVGLAAAMVAGCGGSSGSSTTTSSPTSSASGLRAQALRSGGGAEVRVPDLVGDRFGAAVHEVKQVGLEQTAPRFTGTVGNPHYPGHCQKILNQSPPAGTKVTKGYTVSIVYGVCPKALQHFHP